MDTGNIRRNPGKKNMADVFINLFFILFTIGVFIIPFLFVISVSLTNEDELQKFGYNLIPKQFSIKAYQYVFSNPGALIDAYCVTAFQSVLGTFLGLSFMAMCAYSLSRSNYKLRKPLTFYIFFTMVFNGGLIPSYIVNTQYLHLGNKIWIYIFPSLISGFYIIIIRTFFQQLPSALAESAKVDGASEVRILFQIILPLSKPVLATVALLTLLDRWNNWYTALIYIRNMKLYTLQFLLQKILLETQTLQSIIDNSQPGMYDTNIKLPEESLRYAMCIVAAGPMLVVFPFFQKYFTRGLTVGAVKG